MFFIVPELLQTQLRRRVILLQNIILFKLPWNVGFFIKEEFTIENGSSYVSMGNTI